MTPSIAQFVIALLIAHPSSIGLAITSEAYYTNVSDGGGTLCDWVAGCVIEGGCGMRSACYWEGIRVKVAAEC